MNAALLQKLMDVGTPAELIAEVAVELARAEAATELLNTRRARDRDRKRVPRISKESLESAEIQSNPSPQSPPLKSTPDPEKITPPLTPQPSAKSARKGTRLPADWQPSDADTEFAKAQGHSPERIVKIADSFRDYWTSQPGQRAVRTDWGATWRNWIRKEGVAKPAKAEAKQYVSASGYVYRGNLESVQREAQRRGDNDTYWQIEVDRKRAAQSVGSAIQNIVGRSANA